MRTQEVTGSEKGKSITRGKGRTTTGLDRRAERLRPSWHVVRRPGGIRAVPPLQSRIVCQSGLFVSNCVGARLVPGLFVKGPF